MMNTIPGSPGMKALEKSVEAAILEVLREMDHLGGVLAAVEQRYQRSQIQAAAHRLERQIYDGTRPIIGLNRYASKEGHGGHGDLVRPSPEKQQLQIDRLKRFKEAHAAESGAALDRLEQVVESGGNVFAELLSTVEVCSLGQITERLHEVSGHYRPTV
jgi:methylmalonyl-CoA mutase